LASLQCNNGQELSDSRIFAAPLENSMPSLEKMTNSIKEMCDQLVSLKPLKQEKQYKYTGPVLLEGQASAEFFNQLLNPNLGIAQDILSDEKTNQSKKPKVNKLKDWLGAHILPDFISIIDDPTAQTFTGTPLLGTYKIDADGVLPKKIILVDKGVLKTLCTSRAPAAGIKHSNGHSVSGVGTPSILFISSSLQVNQQELKNKLIELGKKAGLKFVLIIRRLSTYNTITFDAAEFLCEARSNGYNVNPKEGEDLIRAPLLAYKVYLDDGHEELVRGMQFSALTMSIFKDIVCTGDDASPYLVLGLDGGYRHLITPSVLVNNMPVQNITNREMDKLPVLTNPMFLSDQN